VPIYPGLFLLLKKYYKLLSFTTLVRDGPVGPMRVLPEGRGVALFTHPRRSMDFSEVKRTKKRPGPLSQKRTPAYARDCPVKVGLARDFLSAG
jgi:hypothetical protein